MKSTKAHAVYMRTWRKTHPLTPLQRKRLNARTYRYEYAERGKVPKPKKGMVFHHTDYDHPLAGRMMKKRKHYGLTARKERRTIWR
jgi:hypothetical protein